MSNFIRHPDVQRALIFARNAHATQKRKYTGESYVNHCVAVASLVGESKHASVGTLQAALLHDTVEDTNTTLTQVETVFGRYVAKLVRALTNSTKVPAGNRTIQKAFEAGRLAESCDEVHTIKLADLIDNTSSIVTHDPRFAVTYLTEKQFLVEHCLLKGDPLLRRLAQHALLEGFERLRHAGWTRAT